jgi:hypothetical protein
MGVIFPNVLEKNTEELGRKEEISSQKGSSHFL